MAEHISTPEIGANLQSVASPERINSFARMPLTVQPLSQNIYTSVDCVIFGLSETGLQVLLIKHTYEPVLGKWALPGGFIEIDESIEQASERILFMLTGLKDVFAKQFHVFSDVDRFPGLRIITTGVYAIVRPEVYELKPGTFATDAAWVPIEQIPELELAFDHGKIYEKGLEALRTDIRTKPIAFNLLPKKFTLVQLEHLFTSVLQMQLDRRNFRRKIINMEILTELPEKLRGNHPTATLYEVNEDAINAALKDGYSLNLV
jgi:8-oxo-dGTP diphosphatase